MIILTDVAAPEPPVSRPCAAARRQQLVTRVTMFHVELVTRVTIARLSIRVSILILLRALTPIGVQTLNAQPSMTGDPRSG
jgi:hypothetical protein